MSDVAARALVVAGCRLGGIHFAVAMDDVAQLLARPGELTAMPLRDGALLGVFKLGGAWVPMVDLRRWLPWPGEAPAAPSDPSLVLVLRQGACRLAVAIEAVDGLHRIPAGGTHRVAHVDSADDVFGSVVQPTRAAADPGAPETALALLDVAALMRLSRVWAQDLEHPQAPADGTQPAGGLNDRDSDSAAWWVCALLDSQGERLAIPAQHVRSVLPMPALQPLWQGDPNWPGVANWCGRDVPVLKLLPSLGVQAAGTAVAPLLAVLEHDGVCIAIPVDGVGDVHRLDLGNLQPAEALGLAHSPALAGLLLRADGGRTLLIDVPALVQTHPLAMLSTATGRAAKQPNGGTHAHVVVQAGTAWALQISDLLEVIELPDAWVASPDAASPWCHTWRQSAIPMWDLRALKGHGPTVANADTKVLILQSGASPIGLIVEGLVHLLPARSSMRHQLRRPDGRVLPFVVHRDGELQRSFRVLDAPEWPRAGLH